MTSLYTTRELLATSNTFPPVSLALLDLFFPRRFYSLKEEINLDDVDEDRKIAAYVSPLVAAKSGKPAPRRVSAYTPPSVIEMDPIRPDELTARLPGETFDTPLTPDERRDALIAETRWKHQQRIHRRWIQQGMSALLEGRVVVKGDNHPADVIDYGRAPELTQTLSGSSRWDQDGSDPLADLENTAERISDLGNGAISTNVVMDLRAWTLFRRNKRVLEQVNINRMPELALALDPGAPGRGLFYHGRFGVFNIYTYSEGYEDPVTGKMVKYMPKNSVIFGGPDIQGTIAFGGVSVAEREGTRVYSTDIVPDHFTQKNPDGEFIRDQSRPLVIPVNANACAALTVA